MNSLDLEHRPAARWLASSAPVSKAADTWPSLLTRALGPPELAAEADAAAARVKEARRVFDHARVVLRAGVTYEGARRLDAARDAHAAAILASNRAAEDLDAWGRVRLSALLAAVGGAGRPSP